MDHDEFRRLIRQRGEELYRDMPWRNDTRPYYVLVSEIMLQQTQVDRVIPKFESFVGKFPNESELANASLADVLGEWQGLGYNRRAKFLHEATKEIVKHGEFPTDPMGLMELPGIGKNTAGAIMAYAYNKPSIFVETNVRAVYISHFFENQDDIDDKEIIELLKQSIDEENPRLFYWALMDYGSWLKKQGIGPGRSRHYKRQTPLKGSVREVRGEIIRALAASNMTEEQLKITIGADHRFDSALAGLMKDGLISVTNGKVHLTK